MPNSSVGTLIGRAIQKAKTASVTGIPGVDTPALIQIADMANRDFVRAPFEAHQPGWDFMVDECGWDMSSPDTLAVGCASGATSLTLTSGVTFSTTNGAAVIFEDNIPDQIFYTALTAHNMTGVTGVSFAHTALSAIYRLYPLPSTFARPRPEKFKGDGFTINNIAYYYGGSGMPNGATFNVVTDANDNSFVWLPRDITGKALMRYEKNAATLDDVNDLVDIPIHHEEYIVQRLIAHIFRLLGKDAGKIQDADNAATTYLRGAFNERNISRRIQLTRRPTRSAVSIADMHYMDSSGNIY
jgi:hypothetical protein